MDVGVRLNCPSCRRPDGAGGVIAHAVEAERDGGGYRCPDCGTRYPRVEGVPMLRPSPDEVVAASPEATPDDPEAVRERCAWLASSEANEQARREAGLLGTYALTHHPASAPSAFVRDGLVDQHRLGEQLDAWLAAYGPVRGPILELGAGPGGFADLWRHHGEGPVLLGDVRLDMMAVGGALLRRGEATVPFRRIGRRFGPITVRRRPVEDPRVSPLALDALDPPFAPGTFGLVVGLNLLESVVNPAVLLGQMDALLAPDGLLVLGQPFHYEPHAQHPSAWIEGPDALESALTGGLEGVEHLDHRILARSGPIPWGIPAHDRLVHRYGVELMLTTPNEA